MKKTLILTLLAISAFSAPYYGQDEDSHIQQIAEMIVNNGSLPTDGDSKIGPKSEIVLRRGELDSSPQHEIARR